MMTLYDFMGSGNGYKVRLVLAHLGLPYKLVERDILKGETRTPEFLAKNPNGRIPTLQLDDGSAPRRIERHHLVPGRGHHARAAGPLGARRDAAMDVLRAVQPRALSSRRRASGSTSCAKLTPQQEMELPGRMEKGYAALGVMEQHLAHHPFFVDGRYGLADIALYAYTHVAGEGGFNLDNYPARQRLDGARRRAAGPRHDRPQELTREKTTCR